MLSAIMAPEGLSIIWRSAVSARSSNHACMRRLLHVPIAALEAGGDRPQYALLDTEDAMDQFPRDGHPPVIASASRSSVLPDARYQRDLPSPIVVAS